MRKSRLVPAMLASALVGGAVVFATMKFAPSEFAKLESAMDMIESGYIEPVERMKLIDGAIEGMLTSLNDPYTSYMDQEAAEIFYNNINSSFEGIGATLEEVDGRIVVVAPIKGSPAEAAGIQPGDQIVRVGDIDLEGMRVHDAVPMIRGEKGTKAELTIRRGGSPDDIRITVVRDEIPLETVYSEMEEGGIGVVRISSFAETTATEYETHIKKLVAEGLKGLVIDVRQNPGGLTETAEQIAETILEDGKTIVQFERRGATIQKSTATRNDIGISELPIAVLVDRGSASASEILAGALQQSSGVPIVGEKTFGKGTAQISSPFPDGSSMKITFARWLTPNGNSIDKSGLTPDVLAELPEYAKIPLVSEDTEWKENQFSNEVKAIQTMLEALGYSPGRKDGFFDASTKQAVLRFQQAEGLETTGTAAGETTRRMIEKTRNLIAENDTQLKTAVQLVREKIK